jgi:hypothetical protein
MKTLKHDFFSLGLAAISLLFAGKVAAQDESANNSNDSIAAVSSIPKISAFPNFMAIADSLRFDSFPSPEVLIERIAGFSNIIVNYKEVRGMQHLNEMLAKFYPAYYNPVKDGITINLLNVAQNLETYDNPGGRGSDIEGTGVSRIILRKEVNSLNNGILGILLHEIWHMINKHRTSTLGFSIPQIGQRGVHDELSAPMNEMLGRRSIFLKTGDIKQAFIGAEDGGFRSVNRRSPFNKYISYLKKHKADLSEIPSKEEIDIIIDSAIELFDATKSQYIEDIPKISRYKTTMLYREYIGTDTLGQSSCAESGGFDIEIAKFYEFWELNGQNALEIASPEKVARILKTVHDFTNLREVKKEMAELINVFSVVDAMATKYRMENSIPDESFLEISDKKDFVIQAVSWQEQVRKKSEVSAEYASQKEEQQKLAVRFRTY